MATRRMARRQSLIGNLTDVQRRLRFLESQPTKYRLASQVVRRTNIQPKAVSTDQLADSAVTNAVIADNSITSEKIGANEVTNTNIGNDAVTDRNIAPDSIDSSMIKNGEVQTEDLDDDAVTNAKLAPNAVERDNIKDLEVVNSKLGEKSVSNSKILDGQVDERTLALNAVTRNKIANGEVIRDKIANLAINTDKLENDAVTTVKIRNGQVSSEKIGQGQVRTNNIDTQAVTNVKIAEGTIARNRLSFTPTETVRAGNGLSGGGTGRELTLSVNFGAVATAGHTHTQYAPNNHTHSQYSSSSHVHFVSGQSGTGGGPSGGAHSHPVNIASNSPSSLRYKKDITDYTFDLSKLMDLDLKKFRYLNQYKNRSANREWFFGYIAEEVQSLGLEELLAYDQDGLPSGVNYALVGVFTLELVKLQEKRIKTLEDQLRTLSEEN